MGTRRGSWTSCYARCVPLRLPHPLYSPRSWLSATVLSWLAVFLLPLTLSLLTPPVALAQEIRYLYDDLGRLVGVVDGQGNAAAYEYDAAGNLLQVKRFNVDPAAAVAISLVSPNRGTVGTTVQIFGKGFSTTPGANQVAFNGTPAAVTAATPLSLTTTVPTGATTGPITLTTPLGSAVSPEPFRVLGEITVSPTSATVFLRGSQQFTAAEGGTATTSVVWSVDGIVGGNATVGTITDAGFYTAPSVLPTPPTVTVTAAHSEDPRVSASASVLLFQPPDRIVAQNVSVTIAAPPTVSTGPFLAPSASVQFQAAPVPTSPTVVAAPASVEVQASATLSAFSHTPLVAVTLPPFITAVSPASAATGTTNLSITLTGSGFTGATALSFLLNNTPDGNITVSNLSVNADGTQVTAIISITAGATVGVRVVQITAPAGTSTPAGTDGNLFTVQ